MSESWTRVEVHNAVDKLVYAGNIDAALCKLADTMDALAAETAKREEAERERDRLLESLGAAGAVHLALGKILDFIAQVGMPISWICTLSRLRLMREIPCDGT